jgi:hypothetical protein
MQKKTVAIGIIILLIILGVVAYSKRSTVPALSGSSATPLVGQDQQLTDKQVADIVAQVSQHIKLPDETPNIGVVTDIDALIATQPFYAGAKNGDILLIYPSISRAILFDPDEDVIINVGPVVYDNPEGGPDAATQ